MPRNPLVPLLPLVLAGGVLIAAGCATQAGLLTSTPAVLSRAESAATASAAGSAATPVEALAVTTCLHITQSNFGAALPAGAQQLVEGTVANGCRQPVSATLQVVDLHQLPPVTGPSSDPPVAVQVGPVPPGGTLPFQVPVGRTLGAASYTWSFRLAERPAGERGSGLPCWRIGDDLPCLAADARLEGAVAALLRVAAGRDLLATAARTGVVLHTGSLAPAVLGQYEPAARVVTLDLRLVAYSDSERAAVLAHELQHAADHAAGREPGRGDSCLAFEETAFRTEAVVWAALWEGKLPSATTSLQRDFNDLVRLADHDPIELVRRFLGSYGPECGTVPPGSQSTQPAR